MTTATALPDDRSDASSVSTEDLKEGIFYEESEIGEPSQPAVEVKLKKFSLKVKNGAVSGKDRKIEKAIEEAIVKHDVQLQDILFKDRAILDKRILFEGHPGSTLLHIAAYAGDMPATKSLLSTNADVNIKSKDNFSPLHFAIGCGHLDIVRLLLEQGADITSRAGPVAYTPLHVAVQRSRYEIARHLLFRGADIDATDNDGETCLHFAARYAGVDMMRLLLQEDANVIVGNKIGRTALHLACAAGDVEVVKALLAKGASVTARDSAGFTPLDGAINRCQWKVVIHLTKIHAPSKLAEEDKSGKGMMHFLRTRGYQDS